MKKNFKAAISLIMTALIVLAFAVTPALAAPGDGPGPADPSRNQGEVSPDGPHWWGRGDDVTPTPVNPPVSEQPAPEFDAGTTTLIVVVWGDLDADGVRDPEESVLENVFIVLQTETGMSVRFEETDKMGQVCFLNLTPGEYVLDVRPPTGDFLPAEVPVEVLAGQNLVEVGLKPASTGG